jgi:hypothetical protein
VFTLSLYMGLFPMTRSDGVLIFDLTGGKTDQVMPPGRDQDAGRVSSVYRWSGAPAGV